LPIKFYEKCQSLHFQQKKTLVILGERNHFDEKVSGDFPPTPQKTSDKEKTPRTVNYRYVYVLAIIYDKK
jgi:hypothetical protein